MTAKNKFLAGLKWFFFSYIWLAILTFGLDLLSKQLIMHYVPLTGEGSWIPLIPFDTGNFLAITYVQNSGMAFGINFNDTTVNTVVFIIVSIIGAAALIGFTAYKWKKLNCFVKASLMLMISGCIGNLVDRTFYVKENGAHFVVDWIAFFGVNGFPRFNIADSCLVIGTIMLIVYLFASEIKEEKAKKAKEAKLVVGDDKSSDKLDEAKPLEEAPAIKEVDEEKPDSKIALEETKDCDNKE